jgi:hypothetical protein
VGIWVELRCCRQGEDEQGGCVSDQNNGPKGYFPETGTGWLMARRALREQAKKASWVLTRKGWVCSACQAKGSR